jgi:hypothetical protein
MVNGLYLAWNGRISNGKLICNIIKETALLQYYLLFQNLDWINENNQKKYLQSLLVSGLTL